jgi:hypothetical protein
VFRHLGQFDTASADTQVEVKGKTDRPGGCSLQLVGCAPGMKVMAGGGDNVDLLLSIAIIVYYMLDYFECYFVLQLDGNCGHAVKK